MSGNNVPADAPPSYSQATGSSSASSSRPGGSNTLQVPGASKHNGIPPASRRSMEDETRPLPPGWVRTFDPQSHHQFYVDTTKDPPRSIWVHPYDDEQYLSTLSTEERERIEQESMGRGHPPSKQDIIAHETDEESENEHEDHKTHKAVGGASSSSSAAYAAPSTPYTHHTDPELPPRPDDKGKKSFGRKLKDKVTGMTHEQRVQQRQQRAEQERQMYEQHQRIRAAMAQAEQTGQPQLIGKDRDGKDVYVEPPGYGGAYSGGGYGYNPYSQGGVYSTPNARYIRPADPYSRPYGYGYGGGYGLPLALGAGGGLLGGLLLGDLAFGGFGF